MCLLTIGIAKTFAGVFTSLVLHRITSFFRSSLKIFVAAALNQKNQPFFIALQAQKLVLLIKKKKCFKNGFLVAIGAKTSFKKILDGGRSGPVSSTVEYL